MFIPLVAWIFHGIARMMEQVLIVQSAQHFRSHLFTIASGLSMQRHQDNHSGAVIDKVSKAVTALESFGQNIFNYMFTLVNLVGSVLIL